MFRSEEVLSCAVPQGLTASVFVAPEGASVLPKGAGKARVAVVPRCVLLHRATLCALSPQTLLSGDLLDSPEYAWPTAEWLRRLQLRMFPAAATPKSTRYQYAYLP